VALPAGAAVDLLPSTWDLHRTAAGHLHASHIPRDHVGRIEIEWGRTDGRPVWRFHATKARLGELGQVRRGHLRTTDLGVLDGRGRMIWDSPLEAAITFDFELRGVKFAVRASDPALDAAGTREPHGQPTDLSVHLLVHFQPPEGVLQMDSVRVTSQDATATLSGRLSRLGGDPSIDLRLRVEDLDLARLLSAAGLDSPGGAGDLGAASLEARIQGHARDPQSFRVRQSMSFRGPRRPVPAIAGLAEPFVHHVPSPGGPRPILVSPDAPDFVPLGEVPPLFLRALLLSEDAGYYSHRGFDLREVPAALATNWIHGTPVRGASTITQQLAKNLFLTREKSLSRKLQELALALLLDEQLGKERVLEIYLNVIEWGPDLYGLRPASRHYFDREPAELTLKQMAFLICLIPGPVKYQRSFADGSPSPAFETLIDQLIEKLWAQGDIGLEEYQIALGEALVVRRDEAPAEGFPSPPPYGLPTAADPAAPR